MTDLVPSVEEKAFYAVNFVKPSKNPYKAINHLGQTEIIVAIASEQLMIDIDESMESRKS